MRSGTTPIVITQTEAIRAAVLAVVTSGMSMFVLLHIIFISAEQLAGITAFTSNTIILVFLFWKPRALVDTPTATPVGVPPV